MNGSRKRCEKSGRQEMIREEHGRKHITKEQLKIMLHGKDAVGEKNIPDCARKQMAHKPYQTKKGGAKNGRI